MGDSPVAVLFDTSGTPISFGIVQSSLNSTVVPLGANESFVGTTEDLSTYHELDIILNGAPLNATGTLYFEFSSDGANWDVSVPLTLIAPVIVPQSLRIVLRYFRVRYINGPVAQTEFRLTTTLHKQTGKALTRYLNQTIDYNEPVENVRAFISGARPDETFGNVPVSRNNFLKISIDDIGPIAEDRLMAADKSLFGSGVMMSRVSELIADFSRPMGDSDIGYNSSGTGYVTQPDGYVAVGTGTGATASGILFTNATVNYAPGREMYTKFSVSFRTPSNVNSEQRAGIYNASDGFFVGYKGLTFGATIRKGGVDTFIPQSSFSNDLLDGNPNSTFTRDAVPEPIRPPLANIYRIRYGGAVAPVVFQVLAPDSQWVTFHVTSEANVKDIPVINNPSLPITIESVKNGSDTRDLVIYTTFLDGGAVADVVSNQLISLNSKFSSLGQKFMVESTPVVIASDQSAFPVVAIPYKPDNGDNNAITASLVSTVLLSDNSDRFGATIFNNTTLGILFVKLGAGSVSSINYTVALLPGGYYEVPYNYTGMVSGVWNVADGYAQVTEIT